MTKLAYGGYPNPADLWKEQQNVLNEWAETVPAILPRSSPMETWGLSNALTAKLHKLTYTEDESAPGQATFSISTRTIECQQKNAKHAKNTEKPKCSRTTVKQLSQPKRALLANRQPESCEERQMRQGTSRCRRTQLNGVSPDTFELWKTSNNLCC